MMRGLQNQSLRARAGVSACASLTGLLSRAIFHVSATQTNSSSLPRHGRESSGLWICSGTARETGYGDTQGEKPDYPQRAVSCASGEILPRPSRQDCSLT